MEDKIKEIFKQLYKGKMSLEEAEQQVLDLFAVVGQSEQLVCNHPDEAIIRDKPTKYCMSCNRNIK